jgi:hypothetical protein
MTSIDDLFKGRHFDHETSSSAYAGICGAPGGGVQPKSEGQPDGSKTTAKAPGSKNKTKWHIAPRLAPVPATWGCYTSQFVGLSHFGTLKVSRF